MQPIQAVGASPLAPQRVERGDVLSARGTGQPASVAASFKDFLLESLDRANGTQRQAAAAIESLPPGAARPAEALQALEQAAASLRAATQVRDALLAAYNEIKDLRM